MSARLLLPALVLFGGSASAIAGSVREIGFNLNSIQVQAVPASGGNIFAKTVATNAPDPGLAFSGQLKFSADGNTVARMSIDGANQIQMLTPAYSMTGTVDLSSGNILGGHFALSYNMPGSGLATYAFDLTPNLGQIERPKFKGSKYMLIGETEHGQFSSSSFAGQNVGDWYNRPGFFGSFVTLEFMPVGVSATDTGANLDLTAFTAVPVPTAAIAGGAGLFAIFLLQVRRRWII